MSLQATKQINVDVSKHKYISLDAKQYDRNLRYILVTCYNQDELLPINKNTCFASIRYRKPDNYGVFNICEITQDGKILIELTEQMLAVAGTCYADVVIHENVELAIKIIDNADGTVEIIDTGDSGILSTMTFIVNVHETGLNNEVIESSYEYNALNDLIAKSVNDYEVVMEHCNTSERNAKASENAAKKSENAAKKSEATAKASEDAAKASETAAKLSEDAAKASEDSAKASEDSAAYSAKLAQSYAVGGTDARENEDFDNSGYYYTRARAVIENLNGSLSPMGSVYFSELAELINSDHVDVGYSYVVNDNFVTDDTFKEGAGVEYTAGTSVYYTADGYWDCLAGTTVAGVKGNNESDYRKGNVNITAANVGAIPSEDIATVDETKEWLDVTADGAGGAGGNNTGNTNNNVETSKYPKLSDAQKKQLKNLANAYMALNASANGGTGKGTFMYYGDTIRNSYANSECWIEDNEKFGLCCNTFVEMVWMGRDPKDFADKNKDTYSNIITFWEDDNGIFDWGYYPEFKKRKNIGGVARVSTDENGEIIYDEFGFPTVTGYYRFVNPNPKSEDPTQQSYENSYSANSNYNPNCSPDKYLYQQWFSSMMTQADLAYDLYRCGYSIPFEELDVGDLIFTSPNRYHLSDERKTFLNDAYWLNSSHVSMIYNKDDKGNFTIIECTDLAGGMSTPIVKCGTSPTRSNWDRVQAEHLLSNIVLCARHPAAWGRSNMEDTYHEDDRKYRIDYLPTPMQHGHSNCPLIIKPNSDGTMPETNVKKDMYYVFNNEKGRAKKSGIATSFDENFFTNIKTNKE